MAGTRVGINGFGRIGRNMLRAALDRTDIEIDKSMVNAGGEILATFSSTRSGS